MLRNRLLASSIVGLTLIVAILGGFGSDDEPPVRDRLQAQRPAERAVLTIVDHTDRAVAGEKCVLARDAGAGVSEIRVLVGVVNCSTASHTGSRYVNDTDVVRVGRGRLATIGEWSCSSLFVDSRSATPHLQCTDASQNSFTVLTSELP